MTRRFERGNVVGFVLIGVLLTGLLVGGVWLARHPVGTSSEVATDSDTTSTGAQTSEGSSATQPTTDEELKDILSKQASQSTNTQNSSTGTSSSTDATNLPTTGPEDAVFEMIGAMLLVGVTTAYVRSRSTA